MRARPYLLQIRDKRGYATPECKRGGENTPEEVVADRADVPAHHLTFEQKVSFILTELEKESEQNDSGGLLS